MRISLTGFLTPSQLLLAPVILSLLVWSLPGDSLHPHGFSERAEVSFGRALVLLGSYSIAGGIILAALTIHNLVRNGNYYRLFGLDNPIAMNLYLILTYLGAPGQVYLSVLSSIFNGRVEKQGPATRTAEAMTPTFRRSSKADKSGITDPAIYRYSVDYIAPNFNTDSAFADLRKVWLMGSSRLLIVLALMAFMFGIFTRLGGVYAAGAVSLFLVLLTVVGAVPAMSSTVDICMERFSLA